MKVLVEQPLACPGPLNIYVNLFILTGLIYLPAVDPREDCFIYHNAAPPSANTLFLLVSRNTPVKFTS